MLIELTNDYIRFINTSTLQKKQLALSEMNASLLELKGDTEVNKRYARDVFQQAYRS